MLMSVAVIRPFVVIQHTAQAGTPTDPALGLNTSRTLDQPIPQPTGMEFLRTTPAVRDQSSVPT
jgi:hypothetical protein